MLVGDDHDQVFPLGEVVEQGDVNKAEVVGDGDVVSLPVGRGFPSDGDAGGEFEEEMDEEEDQFSGHRNET